MKYLIIALIAMFQLSCATQNSSAKGDQSMKQLMQNGKAVYVENKTINEPVDFTSFFEKHLISNGVYLVNVNFGITFKNCIFNKPVSAFSKKEDGTVVLTTFHSNVSFIGCTFMDTVSFRGNSVHGRTDFTDSSFNKAVSFEELNCHENAYFNRCMFEESLRFQNAFFNRKANFMGSKFYGSVSFQNSLFNSEVQFSTGEFYKYADFTLIDFRGRVLFNYAQFFEKADLSHAIFGQDFDFVCTKNKITTFGSSRFMGKVRFDKAEVSSTLNLKDCVFLLGKPELDIQADKLIQ